jgi:hypothetical protein
MTKSLSSVLRGTTYGTLPISNGGTGETSSLGALTALGAQATLVSGANVKTINGTSILGSGDVTISGGSSATKTISNKTAAYTVVAGDLGKIINCTGGAFTVSLTAAATLGSGFTCSIWNTNTTYTQAITIDPNAAETIDGLTTIILRRGEGLDIVCDGTNWQIDNKKPMKCYAENRELAGSYARPVATGNNSVAIGCHNVTATGSTSFAAGAYGATASGANSIALGSAGIITAGADVSAAIGSNSNYQGSVTATGAGAMALGGSYASGADSFAAAGKDNTGTYGSTGANSITIGIRAKATHSSAIALGMSQAINANAIAIGSNNFASGDNSSILGNDNTASGSGSSVIGGSNIASGQYSFAAGYQSLAAQIGKYTFSAGPIYDRGDAQFGKIVLRAQTSTPAVVLTSDGAAATTTNQLIVATGQSMAIQGTLIAKQSGNGNIAAWNITGAVSNNGGTLTSTGLALTLIGTDSIGLVAPTISLDTTNKAVKITSGSSGAQTRYVATLNTSEVIFA